MNFFFSLFFFHGAAAAAAAAKYQPKDNKHYTDFTHRTNIGTSSSMFDDQAVDITSHSKKEEDARKPLSHGGSPGCWLRWWRKTMRLTKIFGLKHGLLFPNVSGQLMKHKETTMFFSCLGKVQRRQKFTKCRVKSRHMGSVSGTVEHCLF